MRGLKQSGASQKKSLDNTATYTWFNLLSVECPHSSKPMTIMDLYEKLSFLIMLDLIIGQLNAEHRGGS